MISCCRLAFSAQSSCAMMNKHHASSVLLHLVLERDYENIDCFKYDEPIIVSAKTFLSQLA